MVCGHPAILRAQAGGALLVRRATWTVGRGQPAASVGTAFRRKRKNWGLEKIREGAATVFKPTKEKVCFYVDWKMGRGGMN